MYAEVSRVFKKRLFIDTQNCLLQTLTQINVKRIMDDCGNKMKEIS